AGAEIVLRDLSLVDVAAVCVLADAYVGNDSGITQIAAAVSPRREMYGRPNVPATSWSRLGVAALFGPTNPQVWAPRGRHVRVVQSPDGTMDSIAVDAVWEALRAAIETPRLEPRPRPEPPPPARRSLGEGG
ncbi:MAG: hypothetical protein U9R68_06785, partial [Planctomycetota bacterium]|nr:hypothetical protein [Planctomycetota bacterium]